MKTTKWLPWTAAVSAHAAIVAVVFAWPHSPRPHDEPDFVAEGGLVTAALTVDLTPFSQQHCEIHHIAMVPAEVPIYYGTPWELDNPQGYAAANPNEPRADTRTILFPHSERSSWGGCVLSNERTARIYVCSECERAEKQWRLAKQQSR